MSPSVSAAPLDFPTRVWFAWVCFFRVLFDGAFARRVFDVRDAQEAGLALPPKAEPKTEQPPAPAAKPQEPPQGLPPQALRNEGALLLLQLLQREGRFVDFLQQDVSAFDDADIGAAARVVQDGCKKALRGRIELEPIRSEAEGGKLVLDDEAPKAELKLIGDVPGKLDGVRGTLRHKGWRARKAELPEPTKGHDHHVVCPAEVEL